MLCCCPKQGSKASAVVTQRQAFIAVLTMVFISSLFESGNLEEHGSGVIETAQDYLDFRISVLDLCLDLGFRLCSFSSKNVNCKRIANGNGYRW